MDILRNYSGLITTGLYPSHQLFEDCPHVLQSLSYPCGLATGDSDAIRYGAAWSAISGGSSAGLAADQEKSMVMKTCLYNRGYVVLN